MKIQRSIPQERSVQSDDFQAVLSSKSGYLAEKRTERVGAVGFEPT